MVARVKRVAQVERLEAGALWKLDGIGRWADQVILDSERRVLQLERRRQRAIQRCRQRSGYDALVNGVGGVCVVDGLRARKMSGVLYACQLSRRPLLIRPLVCSRFCGSRAAPSPAGAPRGYRRPSTFFQTIVAPHCGSSPFSLSLHLHLRLRRRYQSNSARICVCGLLCRCSVFRLGRLTAVVAVAVAVGFVVPLRSPTDSNRQRAGCTSHSRLRLRVAQVGWAVTAYVVSLLFRP